MAAPGLVSPDNFPTRDPRDRSMLTGRIANPPRYYEFGGADSQAIWYREGGNKSYAQIPQVNVARVDKPTSVKVSKKSSRKND